MKRKINFIILLLAISIVSLGAIPAYASSHPLTTAQYEACLGANGIPTLQSNINDPNITTLTVLDEGVADACGNPDNQGNIFGTNGILSNIINFLLFITGGIAVLFLMIGGLRYVLSSGDQAAVTSAKNTILYAVIGLVIVFIAGALVRFLVGALG